MKATTIFRNFLVLTCLLILATGCFDGDNFIGENIERTGDKYPVVANLSTVSGDEIFQEGEIVELDLRYWSEDPMSSINLYDSLVVDGSGVREQQQVKSLDPDQGVFSEASQTDSLIIEYQIPSDLPDSTTFIDLDVEIVNENGLSETNETATNFAIIGFGVTGKK
jgi:hypothetical protein